MTDRVYPSSKPASTDGVNGAATTTTTANPAVTSTKPQPPRYPYRPNPQYNHRRRHRRSSFSFCCCFLWSIILILILILSLIAAIAATALYVLYRPHRPDFTLTSFKIGKLNLTDNPDGATSRLVTRFNLTLASKNPNNHLRFAYESFALTVAAAGSDVALGNGSIPSFVSDTKNFTSFRTILTAAGVLDVESAKALRSDLRKKGRVAMKVEMDTKVEVTVGGKVKSKKIGIRVTCQGIKGAAPKSATATMASVANAHCKVDLRIKIWRWTF